MPYNRYTILLFSCVIPTQKPIPILSIYLDAWRINALLHRHYECILVIQVCRLGIYCIYKLC